MEKTPILRGITAAWYQREISVPANWGGRRITLSAEYVNSLAIVYVDGKKAGELPFPAGEVDLTALCRPGSKHVVSLQIVALPLKGVLLSHTDSNAAREVKALWNVVGSAATSSSAARPRLHASSMSRSIRPCARASSPLSIALAGLEADVPYTFRGTVHAGGPRVHEFTSKPFKASDLVGGRIAIVEKFKPAKLWDIHTPENYLSTEIVLMGPGDNARTPNPSVNFGFREFWIDGKDFYLNGTRIPPVRSAARQRPGRRRARRATGRCGKRFGASRASASISSIRTTTAANRARKLALPRS